MTWRGDRSYSLRIDSPCSRVLEDLEDKRKRHGKRYSSSIKKYLLSFYRRDQRRRDADRGGMKLEINFAQGSLARCKYLT